MRPLLTYMRFREDELLESTNNLQQQVNDLERKIEYDVAKDYDVRDLKSEIDRCKDDIRTLQYRL